MENKEKELVWSITDTVDEAEDDDSRLDESELSRLAYLAEHPELMDPLIWFLPGRGIKENSGMR
ncbi:MAG: hypothetical protein ACE15F_23795 [bacterium]